MHENRNPRLRSPDQRFDPWGAMKRETRPVWAKSRGNKRGPSYDPGRIWKGWSLGADQVIFEEEDRTPGRLPGESELVLQGIPVVNPFLAVALNI
jgi:hypothetical protein